MQELINKSSSPTQLIIKIKESLSLSEAKTPTTISMSSFVDKLPIKLSSGISLEKIFENRNMVNSLKIKLCLK